MLLLMEQLTFHRRPLHHRLNGHDGLTCHHRLNSHPPQPIDTSSNGALVVLRPLAAVRPRPCAAEEGVERFGKTRDQLECRWQRSPRAMRMVLAADVHVVSESVAGSADARRRCVRRQAFGEVPTRARRARSDKTAGDSSRLTVLAA